MKKIKKQTTFQYLISEWKQWQFEAILMMVTIIVMMGIGLLYCIYNM